MLREFRKIYDFESVPKAKFENQGRESRRCETAFSLECSINDVGVVWAAANQKAPLSTLIGRDVNRFITHPLGGRESKHALKADSLKVVSPDPFGTYLE